MFNMLLSPTSLKSLRECKTGILQANISSFFPYFSTIAVVNFRSADFKHGTIYAVFVIRRHA